MKLGFAFVTLISLAAFAVPGTTATSCPPFDTTPDFTDSCYHEYVLYNVDTPDVDVLILPSASPYAARDATILKESIQMWDDGINNMGSAWLASGMTIRGYSVGLDTIPNEALWDPEVIVVPAEYNPVLLFGIGEQVPAHFCHGVPPPGMSLNTYLASMPDFHQHPGSAFGSLAVQCNDGGYQCFVINTNFLSTPTVDNRRDMYDLNSHEFGHCLGIGHVGDALDFTASNYPQDDIMSYETDGHDAGHVLCVSTLNILALERLYGDMLGQSGYPVYAGDSYVHQAPANWDADNCAEPTAEFADLSPITEADPLEDLPDLGLATCAINAIVNNLLINWVNPVLACVI